MRLKFRRNVSGKFRQLVLYVGQYSHCGFLLYINHRTIPANLTSCVAAPTVGNKISLAVPSGRRAAWERRTLWELEIKLDQTSM